MRRRRTLFVDSDIVFPKILSVKNKTDREAYNGCCPCGHRDSPVCLCVYINETMRGHAAAGAHAGSTISACACRRTASARWTFPTTARITGGAARPAVDDMVPTATAS